MYRIPLHVQAFVVNDQVRWGFFYLDSNHRIEAQLDLGNGEFLNCGTFDTPEKAAAAVLSRAQLDSVIDPLSRWRSPVYSLYAGKFSAGGKWAVVAGNARTDKLEFTGVEFDTKAEADAAIGRSC